MRRAAALLVLLALSDGNGRSIAAPRALDPVAFATLVRPMLQRAGCAAATCHASGLIGLQLNAAGRNDARDLAQVARQVAPGDPSRSPLYRKALGRDHLGGRVLDGERCEGRLLAAWIRGERGLEACPSPEHTAAASAEIPRSLDPLFAGCATSACHGGPSAPRLLDPTRPGAARVNAEALAPSLDRFLPTRSALLKRLLGARHPRLLDGTDAPDYRRLFAWIAGEPPVLGPAPSLAVFEREVQPILVRRGCADGGCHGGGSSDLVLVASPAATLDNYLRLVPRIADGSLPDKPRNRVAHGGGRRLGGDEDCADATIVGWISGSPAGRCRPQPPPDRARFAELVQPSLEKLTCPRCHADEKLGFHFVAHPSGAALEDNYRAVLGQIDIDYPPVSPVLLRVREDCAQARLMAWIERRPDPGCTVELRNFKGSFPSLARSQ